MKAGPGGEISGIQVLNSGSVLNDDEAADNVMNIVKPSYEGRTGWRN